MSEIQAKEIHAFMYELSHDTLTCMLASLNSYIVLLGYEALCVQWRGKD